MNKPQVKITRYRGNDNQTLGSCVVLIDGFIKFCAVSLERGWLNNKRNVSCVPPGTYKMVLEYSNKFKTELWELKGVEGRSEIKFHLMNYYYNSAGCIGLGQLVKDINKDGQPDVTSSRNTMKAFHNALAGYTEVELIIE